MVDHAPRMKEEIRRLQHLIAEEKKRSKPNTSQIEAWEKQILGLEGQLRGGR